MNEIILNRAEHEENKFQETILLAISMIGFCSYSFSNYASRDIERFRLRCHMLNAVALDTVGEDDYKKLRTVAISEAKSFSENLTHLEQIKLISKICEAAFYSRFAILCKDAYKNIGLALLIVGNYGLIRLGVENEECEINFSIKENLNEWERYLYKMMSIIGYESKCKKLGMSVELSREYADLFYFYKEKNYSLIIIDEDEKRAKEFIKKCKLLMKVKRINQLSEWLKLSYLVLSELSWEYKTDGTCEPWVYFLILDILETRMSL